MCMALYAASELPLPEHRDTHARRLTIRPIAEREGAVRARFTKPHVYHIGVGGCSCGIGYDAPESGPTASREPIRQLRAWLADAVRHSGSVELYACWMGEEGEPPAARARITPAYFVDDAEVFALPDRWLATVVAAPSE
jgi:hypothetical protein